MTHKSTALPLTRCCYLWQIACSNCVMPEKQTIERARKDAQEGNAPSTQAGEFVREEMEHIREGKHGARSTKQAIANRTIESAPRRRQTATA